MQKSTLEQPQDSGLVACEPSTAKKSWEPPHLDALPLSETRAALGGGLDGALAGTMS